ncbi:MAG: tRNA epoxyqueuosine(34) reductase QueG [Acidobacteria bacterium]|nr:tRNA epoxyqueuosine(34) reductase QueG [Acidobacteriota bacterium]
MIPEEIIEIPASLQRSQFLAAASVAGFQLAGAAPAAPMDDYPIYNQWVTGGLAGPMAYLADHRAPLRADPRSLLSSARSVLCLGLLYNTPGPAAPISRYAWGAGDYHDLLRHRLTSLVQSLEQVWGAFEYKICVDTAPLLERSLARLAGLGWIGRNTCLINQSSGSWFFLGEILTSVELEPDRPPPDRCGSCTRCVDACPTQALVPAPDGRWRLDARLCISTWTIEQHGALPAAHRSASGQHVFGCDICQEVCPWNSRAPFTAEPAFQPANPGYDLAELATLTPESFRQRFRHTPVWRAKYAGLMRNVATAMGNSGDPRHIEPLRRLATYPDAAISEHALWALGRLERIA